MIFSISTMCCICLIVVSSFGFGMWKKSNQEPIKSSEGNSDQDIDLISSFNVDNPLRVPYTPPQNGEYPTPQNGDLYFSLPLSSAMEKYQDDAIYRVFIDMFDDGNLLSSESDQAQEEVERLSNVGYDITLETCFNGISYRKCIIMNAKLNQLKEFDANENYGYFMFLYDERVEID